MGFWATVAFSSLQSNTEGGGEARCFDGARGACRLGYPINRILMEVIFHSRKSCDTLLPDDVFHLCHFGSIVGAEIWHVQSGVAFMHVLNYSYSSFIIYFSLDCKSVLFYSSPFF
jgi:hypothetical protein